MALISGRVNNLPTFTRNFTKALLLNCHSREWLGKPDREWQDVIREFNIMVRPPMYRIARLACMALCVIFACPALAKEAEHARPESFQKLLDCRSIADNAARLTCFDDQAAKLDQAEANKQLIIVDREQVKQARRGLFGLSLPDLGGLFGGKGGETDADELSEISSTITSVRSIGYGNWLIVLEDGAKWQQVGGELALSPKPGQPVQIRKASLGSYFAKINKQPAIRVARVN